MPPGRITELAAEIMQETLKVENYLEDQQLPTPSFSPSFPVRLPLPDSVTTSVQRAIEAADELQSLLLGPLGFILHQLDGTHNLISLHTINRFKVASKFPVGDSMSFSDIAVECGVDEDSMRRILRHAITNHLFTEPTDGHIAHTSISKALAQVPMLHEWVTVSCEEIWPPTTRLTDALVKWPASMEPDETAYNLASRNEGSFFQSLASSPERTEAFSKAMGLFKIMPGFDPSVITRAQLWQSVADGTVVDVGGADGAVAYDLVQTFPSMKIVVQDLPHVIESACSAEIPSDLIRRITFQAHDFFTEQTVVGADVYLFRMIFHDWSDKFCLQILQQLIPALKPGARLLVNDFCIPETGTSSLYQERIARCHDLSMKAMFNGKERTRKEWETLLSHADSRFGITSVTQMPNSPLALFEVIWEP